MIGELELTYKRMVIASHKPASQGRYTNKIIRELVAMFFECSRRLRCEFGNLK